jgi:MFS family permease
MVALLGAEGISQIGNTMTIVAGPWFVLQTTGSAARTGIVGAALAIGAVVPALLGGPLVDRLGFKRASVFADLTCAGLIAAVPLLHLAGALEFWHLLVLVFLLSSVNSQGDTARFALVPFLARRAVMPIERVNAADRAVVRLGQVAGPLVAAGLIVAIGAVNVLFVDAATFSLSAILVAIGVPKAANQSRTGTVEGGRRYSELVEGLRFVRASGFLLSMVLVATLGNFMDKPLISVIAPVYAKTVYGTPTSLGVVVGAFGVGALVGSLVFWSRGKGLAAPAHLSLLLLSWTAGHLRDTRHDSSAPDPGCRGGDRRADIRPGQRGVRDDRAGEHTARDAGARLRGSNRLSLCRRPHRRGPYGFRDPRFGVGPDDRRYGCDLRCEHARHVPEPGTETDGRGS